MKARDVLGFFFQRPIWTKKSPGNPFLASESGCGLPLGRGGALNFFELTPLWAPGDRPLVDFLNFWLDVQKLQTILSSFALMHVIQFQKGLTEGVENTF